MKRKEIDLEEKKRREKGTIRKYREIKIVQKMLREKKRKMKITDEDLEAR